MSPALKQYQSRALKFSPEERAVLAANLIASLDTLDAAAYERLWLKEADRRYKAYKAGKITARPAEDVLRDALRKVK
jgi:putative addiction module component (TIGR02574 family)